MSETLKERLARFEWRSDAVAEFEGVLYFFEPGIGITKPPEGATFVFKPKRFLELYAEILADAPVAQVMELGIFKGGSLIALAAYLDVEKLVGVDIDEEVPEAKGAFAQHPAGERITAYWRTSQDDKQALEAIVEREFPTGIDLVIDDASHLYAPSRRSFEILFPHVRPGGWYVYEDWGWAHVPEVYWPEEPSPASLVFELQLAWLCSPELIGRVVVHREMVFVQKHPSAPLGGDLSLSDLYTLHHRSPPLIA